MRLYFLMVFLIIFQPFSTLDVYAESTSPKDIKNLQIALATLDYNVGYFDGSFGNKTKKALTTHLKKLNVPWDGDLNSKILKRITSEAAKARQKFAFNSYDDFSTKSLKPYELTNLKQMKVKAGSKPYKFHVEKDGNTFLKISTINGTNIQDKGQPCTGDCVYVHQSADRDNKGMARGQTRADKFEIRLTSGKKKENIIWFGFRIRKAENFEDTVSGHKNCQNITFGQFKNLPDKVIGLGYTLDHSQIGGQINGRKPSTIHTPGKGFPMITETVVKGTGYYDQIKKIRTPWPTERYKEALIAFKKRGVKSSSNSADFTSRNFIQIDKPTDLPNTIYTPEMAKWIPEQCGYVIMSGFLPMFQKNRWTTYKVGVSNTRKENGWIEVYQNDKLMYRYVGVTLKGSLGEPMNIGIGLYRNYRIGNELEQSLDFDDFVATGNKNLLDGYLGIKRMEPNI